MSTFAPIADQFDQRAGLPEAARSAIAHALLGLGPLTPHEAVLDVGCGTGEIGLELCAAHPGYVGVDVAPEMLAVFRRRAAARGLRPTLHAVEPGAAWPVPASGVAVVFGSRSLHLLEARSVLERCAALAGHRGMHLVEGGVERARDSARAVMRRLRRQHQRAIGHEGRSGRKHALRHALEAAGYEPVTEVVAAWPVAHRPSDSLRFWRALDGLDNVVLDAPRKAALLDAVEQQARALYGDLDQLVASEERYVLTHTWLPGCG